MWGPVRSSVTLDQVCRLLQAPMGLLGFFTLDLLAPLGITVWNWYDFPLGYVSRLSLKHDVSLPFVALACAGLIVTGYFLSIPVMNVFYAAVNRKRGVLYLWVYSGLLVQTRAAGDTLRAAQENLQHSGAQLRVTADATLPLTPHHHHRILQTSS